MSMGVWAEHIIKSTVHENRRDSRLYERLIESSEADADSFVSSEVAKDFMARLRIGIMADQAPVRDMKDGPSADL